MTTTEIANKIRHLNVLHKPIVIAIDGFGGAGKSTLARELANVLESVYVVEIDDFFLQDVKSDANKSNFDRERLKEQVLIPLTEKGHAAYQKLEWDMNKLSSFHNIPEVDYVIIEGVSSFHPDIADYIDYKIWLEIPPETAKQRMITRDKALGNEHGELWDHWTESYQMYKDLHKPETKADLLVNHKEEEKYPTLRR